jgi:hypothetical protein
MNDPSGFVFSLASTLINVSGNFYITANPSFTTLNGSVCTRVLTSNIMNVANCPALSLTPTSTTIGFSFITNPGTHTYTIQLLNLVSPTPISSQTVVSTAVQTIAASFVGLTAATGYRVNIVITTSGVDNTCPLTTVNTLP